jgi:hypothetical protein
MNKLGLPRPICGQFASVYELENGGSRWAVKCFLRNIPDLHSRYAKISAHLSKCELPYFITFEYQQKGIRVRGDFYPIVKMEWVEGLGLNQFVENNLSNKTVLAALERDWLSLLEDLQSVRVAHGDLQHGNVLVTDEGCLRLIDYDGMWVPKLKGQKSHETGHPDYQSPLRTQNDYNSDIDQFAGDVIHVAIRALSAQPKLWQKYNNGDNLLFRRQDYLDPHSSDVFRDVEALGDEEIRSKTHDLIAACGVKPKRGRPSRFFRPKKAKAASGRKESGGAWKAEKPAQAAPRPAAPAPSPPAARPSNVRKPAAARAPSPVLKPAPARPPPSGGARPAAPKTTGSWLDDHVGATGGTRRSAPGGATRRRPAARPSASGPPLSFGKQLLGYVRLFIHVLLLAPVAAVSVMELKELTEGYGDRATAILMCGFGIAAFLGLLSMVSLFVGRRIHRVVSTLFFGLTAVIMLLNIFSELLTVGLSEWTGDTPGQCALMLSMLVLSGLGLLVEFSCYRLGLVTRWRVPWAR